MERALRRAQLHGLLRRALCVGRLFRRRAPCAAFVVRLVGRRALRATSRSRPGSARGRGRRPRQHRHRLAVLLDALGRTADGSRTAPRACRRRRRFASDKRTNVSCSVTAALRVVAGVRHVRACRSDRTRARLRGCCACVISCAPRLAAPTVRPAVVAALRGDLRREQRALQQQPALHRERAVARGRVHDLVAEHGRELGFGVELGQQAAIHCDLAARQRPGVRHRAIQHDELVRQLRGR